MRGDSSLIWLAFRYIYGIEQPTHLRSEFLDYSLIETLRETGMFGSRWASRSARDVLK